MISNLRPGPYQLRRQRKNRSATRARDRIATAPPSRRDANDRNQLRQGLGRAHISHHVAILQAESKSDCAWLPLRARLKLHKFHSRFCGLLFRTDQASIRSIQKDNRARHVGASHSCVVLQARSMNSSEMFATETRSYELM